MANGPYRNSEGIRVSVLSRGTKTLDGRRIVVDGLAPLAGVAERIRSSPDLAAKTTALRAALQAEGRTGPYERNKLAMPAIMPAAQAPIGTPIRSLPLEHHNGLYGFDIDEGRETMELEEVRRGLRRARGAVMVGTSCAGDALFAIFAGPYADSATDYEAHWAALAAGMPESARVNNGAASKNFNRLCFLAYDPDVWFNSDWVEPQAGAAVIATVSRNAPPAKPADVDQDDDSAALAWVMPPDEYNAWLGWLPTLKAVGFTVDQVEAWAALGDKHKPSDVVQRWATLPDDNPDDARNKLRGHAYTLGWRPRRQRWRVDPSRGLSDRALSNDVALSNALFELDLTSDGFAERLLNREASRLLIARYQTREGPYDGKPYHLSQTGLWVEDSPKLKHLLADLARDEVVKAFELDLKAGAKVLAAAKRMKEQPAAEAIGRLAVAADRWKAEGHPRYRELTTCEIDELDHDGRFLGCANGVVDLEEQRLLPPAEARRHKVTRSTGIRYDATATHWAVDKLTEHLEPDLAEYLWASLGRALWGRPEKAFTFIIGPPNGGKSTLIGAVAAALGGEAGSISEDLLRVTRSTGKVGPTPEREPLATKRIVHAAEAESWSMDKGKLKAFAGSFIDRVTYQPKYQAERTVPVRATIFIAANDYPRLDLTDEALADRLRIVPYPRPGSLDPEVARAFVEDAGAARAMLAKLVRAAWHHPPGVEIVMPDSVALATQARIVAERGPFAEWLATALVHDEHASLSGQVLWKAWASYCGVQDERDDIEGVKRASLARRFKAAFSVDSANVYDAGRVLKGWKGLRLSTDSDRQGSTTSVSVTGESQQAAAAVQPPFAQELDSAIGRLEAELHEYQHTRKGPRRAMVKRGLQGTYQALKALRGFRAINPDDIITADYLAGIRGGVAFVVQQVAENAAASDPSVLVEVDWRGATWLLRQSLEQDRAKVAASFPVRVSEWGGRLLRIRHQLA